MAKTILGPGQVFTINGVNLSDHVSSVAIAAEKDDVDLTAFGQNGHQHGAGLSDDSVEFEFYQDFAAASTHATLYAIYAAGVAVPIVIKPTAAAVSATNPSATLQGILLTYGFLDGSPGEASMIEANFVDGTGAGLVIATS